MSDNYYLMATSIDWADEFDVDFGEIIDEEAYQKYTLAKSILCSIKTSYCFGSNEGWEGDFELLNFNYKKLTQEQYNVLTSLGLPNGRGIIDKFYYWIDEFLDDYGYKNPNHSEKYNNSCEYSMEEFEKALKFIKEKEDEGES